VDSLLHRYYEKLMLKLPEQLLGRYFHWELKLVFYIAAQILRILILRGWGPFPINPHEIRNQA
jgi:hypothetical protein